MGWIGLDWADGVSSHERFESRICMCICVLGVWAGGEYCINIERKTAW
jgi:hypothetical protein